MVDSASLATLLVAHIKKNTVSIYPNPSNGKFIVESKDLIIERIDIMNIDGTIVYSLSNAKTKFKLISDFKEKGAFILKILLSNKQILTEKILIQ